MPVTIWLPWKYQVPRAVTCHIILLPDNFLEKVTKFGGVCFNIEKAINVQSRPLPRLNWVDPFTSKCRMFEIRKFRILIFPNIVKQIAPELR